MSPISWFRRSLNEPCDYDRRFQHWGANAVELEPMRYRPRAELTEALNSHDLIQVVAGGPALAAVAAKVSVPVILQVATLVNWERPTILAAKSLPHRTWGRLNTIMTSRVEKVAIYRSDVILVENDLMLQQIRSMGKSNVVKAPPGIDTNRFKPHPAGWRADGYLLSVCRLGDPRKGLERTVLAYQELVAQGGQVPDLVLAGRGVVSTHVADLIRTTGIRSRITIRPNINPVELPSLYQGASVFLQTSYEEGLGIAVAEAMAAGLPVVATETAGSRETVAHGVTGWLVSQSPAERLAVEVAGRVRDALSDGSRISGSARNRAVDMFSTDATLRRFMDVYESALR
jgi:glycosyltransferase involved in cell wall biosynthesis